MRNSRTSKRPWYSTTLSKMFSMMWESIRWPSASTTSWKGIETSIVGEDCSPQRHRDTEEEKKKKTHREHRGGGERGERHRRLARYPRSSRAWSSSFLFLSASLCLCGEQIFLHPRRYRCGLRLRPLLEKA